MIWQSGVSTVIAPCGTSCQTTIPDKSITRSKPMPTETAPCPSLIVSSIAKNGTSPSATGKPTPTSFAGGASHVAGSFEVVAVAGAAVAVFAL